MNNNILTSNKINQLISQIVIQNEKNSIISYTYIKNLLSLLSIPIPSQKIPKGTMLFRCRAHSNNEKYFYNISDISYRTDYANIIEFGRANEPAQSIFYCSDNYKTSFIETSIITRQNKELSSETLTTGVWRVEEDITVGYIISNKEIEGLNPSFENLNVEFKKLVELYRNDGTEDHLKMLDFFSKEFTKDVKGDYNKYKISCAFANYLYDKEGQNASTGEPLKLDGILYPSALNLEMGINLALFPKAIDENRVTLTGAKKGTMILKENKNYVEENVIVNKSIDYLSGKIIWE